MENDTQVPDIDKRSIIVITLVTELKRATGEIVQNGKHECSEHMV